MKKIYIAILATCAAFVVGQNAQAASSVMGHLPDARTVAIELHDVKVFTVEDFKKLAQPGAWGKNARVPRSLDEFSSTAILALFHDGGRGSDIDSLIYDVGEIQTVGNFIEVPCINNDLAVRSCLFPKTGRLPLATFGKVLVFRFRPGTPMN